MTMEYIVKDFNGAKKRNYFIGDKNILLESGKKVDESIVKLFTKEAQKMYFEPIIEKKESKSKK